ncbi:M48 family metallopeptidase [Streptomyces sp. NBC_00249]|uniref:M48 family metalloprotease n=1 Tax=Streptomyces sp. NBC_00249 TaxID=2975690 RepID=UPI00224FACC3|nr:M48 family metalloprotease [Streptomyces sp. NBC_00249]MCX5199362.1 M48 family metallopeptidase [Streptomyces sp. NBC_00249]
MIAISGTVFSVGLFWVRPFLGDRAVGLEAVRACVEKYAAGAASGDAEAARRLALCGGLSDNALLWIQLGVLGCFWALVALVYWILPGRRIRRRGYGPLGTRSFPGIHEDLARLMRSAGMDRRVNLLVDLLDGRVNALAFGRVGKRYVLLSRGLIALRDTDPEAFRAIVLHELAHLRNRDVDIAYLTLISSQLFSRLVAIPVTLAFPLAVFDPSAGPASFYLGTAAGTLLLGLAVPLTRNAVLRSREFHADARAASWENGGTGLAAVLTSQREIDSRAAAPPVEFLRPHPLAARRLDALRDPAPLFSFVPWEGFALGLVCAIAQGPVTAFTSGFLGLPASHPLAALPAALPLAGGAVYGLWRAESAAFRFGRGVSSAHRAAVATGIGFVTGTVLRPTHLGTPQMGPSAPAGELAVWLFLLFLGSYVFVQWLAHTARAWAPLEAVGRLRGLLVAGVMCCALVPLSFGLGLSYVIHPSDVALAFSASPDAGDRGTGTYLMRVLAVAQDEVPLGYGVFAAAALAVVPLSGRITARAGKPR